MTNIHIIQGKATLGANLMAAKVKGSGKYDHRVMDLTSETCSILFRQRDPLAANLAHRSVRLNFPEDRNNSLSKTSCVTKFEMDVRSLKT